MPLSHPDGIEDLHFSSGKRQPVVLRFASLLLLGGLLIAALLGVFGGVSNTVTSVRADAATLTVDAPRTLRNGEFFEMRIRVDAARPIARPVLAVTPAYWRELTINTMIPAASDEESAGGMFRFTYPAMPAGETLEIKIDGQVNPSVFAGTAGAIVLFDGEREVARLPMNLRVLP